MKKTLIAIALIASIITLPSCSKEGVKTVSASALIDESGLSSSVTKPDNYSVTFTNISTTSEVTVVTENGTAAVSGLVPGIYKVTATATTVSGGFTYTISASESSASIVDDGTKITLKVAASKESALLFKEIYYTGCTFKDTTGTAADYFRDQYYEIYNNSDQTVYADSLCIAETRYAYYDFSFMYTWNIPNPENYVFCSIIWQMPGTGKDYPIKPGESIIVAQWATNHKAKNLTNGGSPVDLSGAEFEAITKSRTLWNGIVITDGPAINMTKAVNSDGYDIAQWLTPVTGGAYVIFKPSTPLKNSDFITATNATWGNTGREVPLTDILDGVQAVEKASRATTLGLPSSVDAGYIFLSKGSYTGQSISRKVAGKTADGRVILQDTNNTTNDFQIQDTPTIRRDGAGKPSWNTWAK